MSSFFLLFWTFPFSCFVSLFFERTTKEEEEKKSQIHYYQKSRIIIFIINHSFVLKKHL